MAPVIQAVPTALSALDLAGKAVFLRLDLNVPMHKGRIVSDARLVACLPTLRHCIAQGARLAVASHLGRPDGRRSSEASMLPIAIWLQEQLGLEVVLSDDCTGDGVRGIMRGLASGQVACLENLRFWREEEENNPAFARALAAPFDVYLNDAFGAAHRCHASIVGMVPYVRESAIGPLMASEMAELEKLRSPKERPFVACVGGAKVADKLGVLDGLIGRADTVLLGGAMAYTFLAASGVQIGRSKVELERLPAACELLQRALARGTKIELPQDHIAAHSFEAGALPMLVTSSTLPPETIGMDIGPVTRATYADHLRAAGTAFWNGPMGVAEWPAFVAGTNSVAEALAHCPGYTVVGGGDAIAALSASGHIKAISHVSTGGGASLAYLQRGTLVGIDALRRTA